MDESPSPPISPLNASSAAPADLDAAYARLRRIAQRLMNNERQGHTLSATELLHEALARLLHLGWRPEANQNNPGAFVEFVRNASHAMTQVLVDHARRRGARKRGGGRGRVQLDDVEQAVETPGFDWIVLDEALGLLRRTDPRRHDVVVMHFFAGLEHKQIAQQLGIDERTVRRDWAGARLWLKARLKDAVSDTSR